MILYCLMSSGYLSIAVTTIFRQIIDIIRNNLEKRANLLRKKVEQLFFVPTLFRKSYVTFAQEMFTSGSKYYRSE